MGLSISPCKWIQYIGYVMEKIIHPDNYIAIIDDLLVHSREPDHMDRILDMLTALVEHGLKLSPKKCQSSGVNWSTWATHSRLDPMELQLHPLKPGLKLFSTPQPPQLLRTARAFVELSIM